MQSKNDGASASGWIGIRSLGGWARAVNGGGGV